MIFSLTVRDALTLGYDWWNIEMQSQGEGAFPAATITLTATSKGRTLRVKSVHQDWDTGAWKIEL